jgi:hypothetical protein
VSCAGARAAASAYARGGGKEALLRASAASDDTVAPSRAVLTEGQHIAKVAGAPQSAGVRTAYSKDHGSSTVFGAASRRARKEAARALQSPARCRAIMSVDEKKGRTRHALECAVSSCDGASAAVSARARDGAREGRMRRALTGAASRYDDASAASTRGGASNAGSSAAPRYGGKNEASTRGGASRGVPSATASSDIVA